MTPLLQVQHHHGHGTTTTTTGHTQREEEKKEEEEASDWRSVLAKLNQAISQVEALPKDPEPPPPEPPKTTNKDFIDIKLEYRRIKIQEQCRKLNTTVHLPSRSSWRDRISGGADQSVPTSSSSSYNKTDSPKLSDRQKQRNLSWGQRRTKVYHIDTDIDVHKFKIIDTIHIKRSQIEARLAEYSAENRKRSVTGPESEVLMLTYSGQHKEEERDSKHEDTSDNRTEDVEMQVASNADQITDDGMPLDPNLDGLSLKDNTKKKLTQFTKHMTDDEKAKKIKSPPIPRKKKYNASVDWREELKNRDKAKQLEALKGYKMGMPDYKEPEKEKEEKEKEVPVDNKWGKSSKNKWERINLKPTARPEEKRKDKDTANKVEEPLPFKVSLRPVMDRKSDKADNIKVEKKASDKFNQQKRESSEEPSKILYDRKAPNSVKKEDNQIKSKKIPSRRNSVQTQEEKTNQSKSKTKKQPVDDKQYIIKVINFVAIKVPVEESKTPPRRKKVERKPSQKTKPPLPTVKPPSLPEEVDIAQVFTAEECVAEGLDMEIVSMLQSDIDGTLNSDALKGLLIEIIKDNPDLKKANVKKEKIQMCPKSKTPSKPKEEQSFDEKYFRPKRKKMIDLFIPEHVPNFKREEVKIEPVKFSSVSDNCVTKSLFIGSQYVGQRNK